MPEPVMNQYQPCDVSSPGETLQETIEALGMTQVDLAERMGRPKKTINEIVQGKAAITAETALQLERVLRVPADFWLNRENRYREHRARQSEAATLADDASWARKFPLKKMISYDWIRGADDRVSQVRELLSFFGVASRAAWEQKWSQVLTVRFRKSTFAASDAYAIAAWLQAGELQSRGRECASYDPGRFQEALAAAKALSASRPEDFADRLRQTCSETGVAVAFVRELPRAPIYGATRWLGRARPLLQLSLRYSSDDQFWFSFFHEACHILRHGKKQVFLDFGPDGQNPLEREADRFAARTLIPESPYQQFARRDRFSKASIRRFASQVGIAPGIVVGRLQKDGRLPFSHCNDLKKHLNWAEPG
jgi:HTH-type transcriptional regulator/antitoxin HigA